MQIQTNVEINGEETKFIITTTETKFYKYGSQRTKTQFVLFIDGGVLPNGEEIKTFDYVADAMAEIGLIVEALMEEGN